MRSRITKKVALQVERLEERDVPTRGMEWFLFAVDVTPPSQREPVVVHPSPLPAHEGLAHHAELNAMAKFTWDKCGNFPAGQIRIRE